MFVHGFNVNPTECRSSAAEMFKRLWQSGLKSMFTVVEWFGDEEQYAPPNLSTFSLNFYVNTLHAFQTASSLASACANLPGQKVMIAHSLGNVLVSAAIKDYGLTYERYYLMNAAVPMEAFDSSAFAIRMITADSAWDSVPRDYCSPKWYMLFSPTDFRSSLSWKGRFSGLQNLVNCYSSTEDVVGNILEGQPLLSRTVWALQETIKGTSYIHVLNGTALFDIACEGGWGVNTYYELNPLWYLNGFTNRILTEGLSRIEQITHPLFTPFRTEAARMHSVDDFVRVDSAEQCQLRAKFLGDAIPAESYAVGANPMSPSLFLGNISLMNCMSNVSLWPEERIVSGQKCWQHSDFKNLAFFYVYKFYEKIVFNEVQ